MSDAINIGESTNSGLERGKGLADKNEDVKAMPITAPGTTFDDVIYSDSSTAPSKLWLPEGLSAAREMACSSPAPI
jgi:hypothetical protein